MDLSTYGVLKQHAVRSLPEGYYAVACAMAYRLSLRPS